MLLSHSQRTVSQILVAVAVLILPLQHVLAQGTSASIVGTVTAQDGTPLDSVIVTYFLGPGQPSGDLPIAGGMLTGKDGVFTFSNLVGGLYYLCAIAPPEKSVLDSCEWTRAAQTVVVAAGKDLTGVQVILQPGVRLEVRINDPKNALAVPVLNQRGGSLSVGLFEPAGFFHQLPMRSFDAAGLNHEMVVPAATPLTMNIGGQGLAVTDANGVAVANQGGSRPVLNIPAGSAPTLVIYTVTPVATAPAPTATNAPPRQPPKN